MDVLSTRTGSTAGSTGYRQRLIRAKVATIEQCTPSCKNLALYIRDCESLCLSDETVKAVGPFYLVSMPGEVKDPTQGVNV